MTKFPNSSPKDTTEIEARMRGYAPALPPTLRSRTLERCTQRAREQQQRQNRLHGQLTWAVAGVLAIQWMTLFLVDAQNTRLIAGNSSTPLSASLSLSEVNQLWHQRSRQIAQLMEASHIG